MDENFKEQLNFVIITTEAQGDMKSIHFRMPLIIKDKELDLWLNKNTSIERIGEILKSNNDNKLIIKRCEKEGLTGSGNSERYEQIRMF